MQLVPIHELTDDDFERELLLEPAHDYILDDDPHAREVARLCTEIANIRLKMGRTGNVASLFLVGYSRQKIAEELGLAYQTVCNVLKSDRGKRMLHLIERLRYIEDGPKEAQRAAMLWRIARREEILNPRVAISAIDILNKQKGAYVQEDQKETGLVVNINQFSVGSPPTHELPAVAREKPVTVEGEFTPITVDLAE